MQAATIFHGVGMMLHINFLRATKAVPSQMVGVYFFRTETFAWI